VAGAVWFRAWGASAAESEATATVRGVAEYRPGAFCRRELPCLLAALALGPEPDVIIVDGYAWLGGGRPGLGAALYEALGRRAAVVGVAKTRFAGAADAVPVLRGGSRSPLYVTAAGLDPAGAARRVAGMHGAHRMPTLLRRADRLARTAAAADDAVAADPRRPDVG
jgi:deoxyribonuclease V